MNFRFGEGGALTEVLKFEGCCNIVLCTGQRICIYDVQLQLVMLDILYHIVLCTALTSLSSLDTHARSNLMADWQICSSSFP